MIRKIELGLMLAGLLFAAYYVYGWVTRPTSSPTETAVVATAAPAVAHEVTQAVTFAPIQAYVQKEKVATALKLPDRIVLDKDIEIISAPRVRADRHDHDVSTVINKKTGVVEVFDTRRDLPWFATAYTGSAGVYYGVGTGGDTAVRVMVQQDFLRIKSVSISGIASADQSLGGHSASAYGVTYFTGVGARLDW